MNRTAYVLAHIRYPDLVVDRVFIASEGPDHITQDFSGGRMALITEVPGTDFQNAIYNAERSLRQLSAPLYTLYLETKMKHFPFR